MSIQSAISVLSARKEVKFAEPNYFFRLGSTPNDASYNLQYGPQQIYADQAWDIWHPLQPVIIAIIDSGVDDNHPDLKSKILRGTNNVVIGYDAINNTTGSVTDVVGHGTHVAGIAAAQVNNTGIGIAGIAGWDGQTNSTDTASTKIMPVRVLDSNNVTPGATAKIKATYVSNAIILATNNGANIINMSLYGYNDSATLNEGVQYAWNHGCVVVSIAGNDFDDPTFTSFISYPGALPNVLSTAADDRNNTLAKSSNYGSWINVSAPGDRIFSTLPTYASPFGINYGTVSGTSMACPHVSGEAALMMAQNPYITNNQVVNFITANVDAVQPYIDTYVVPNVTRTIGPNGKGGRVNAYKALQVAAPGVSVGVADFNGDGKPDIVFQNQFVTNSAAGNVAFWFVGGSDFLTTTGGLLASGAGPKPISTLQIVGTGDFNGDGQADLVFQDTTTNAIAFWFMNQSTVVSGAYASQTPGAGYHVVGIGDFNGDGKPDIVFQNQSTGQIAIWYMNGTTFLGGAFVPTIPGAGYLVVGVGDFNHDGKSDLVFQNQTTGQIVVWYMDNTTYSGGGVVSTVPAVNYKVVGIADFNGDGKPDLLFQNTATGQMARWLMDGLNVTNGGLIH